MDDESIGDTSSEKVVGLYPVRKVYRSIVRIQCEFFHKIRRQRWCLVNTHILCSALQHHVCKKAALLLQRSGQQVSTLGIRLEVPWSDMA